MNSFTRILSYLTPITLEKVQSAVSGELQVVMDSGRVMLNSPAATYSYEDRYTSFQKALKEISPRLSGVQRALVLGLGLGSVPYMLQKHYAAGYPIDCVEVDPEVIRLAHTYYPLPEKLPLLHIQEADAIAWMAHNTGIYDLVIVDIFIDTKVPESARGVDFLRNLRRSVAPGGTLLFSRLLSRQRFEQELWANLRTVFPEGYEIDTGGNVILCFQAP